MFTYVPPWNQLLLCVASVVKKKLYCIVIQGRIQHFLKVGAEQEY